MGKEEFNELYCYSTAGSKVYPCHALFISIFCNRNIDSEHVEIEYIIECAQLILIILEVARIVVNDN